MWELLRHDIGERMIHEADGTRRERIIPRAGSVSKLLCDRFYGVFSGFYEEVWGKRAIQVKRDRKKLGRCETR